jgi:hypothetical protein
VEHLGAFISEVIGGALALELTLLVAFVVILNIKQGMWRGLLAYLRRNS